MKVKCKVACNFYNKEFEPKKTFVKGEVYEAENLIDLDSGYFVIDENGQKSYFSNKRFSKWFEIIEN